MGKQNETSKVKEIIPTSQSEIPPARAALGARLRVLREERGLNQVAFADLFGLTKQTQIAYESGERVPDADYLAELYYRFAVDLGPLITGAPRAKATKLSAAAEEMLFKYEALPKKLRATVDDVLLLAWLGHQASKADNA